MTGFKVVWADDTSAVTSEQLEEIARSALWANGLTYCDMEGFAILEDGALILLDECGTYRCVPDGIFRVEINND